jgi:photosystem II stability/assembly factor-like uncharacterized protein
MIKKSLFISVLALPLLAASCLNPLAPDQGSAGIIRTTDGGADWSYANALPSAPNGLAKTRISSVLFSPENPDVVYAGSYDDGVFKSDDGGVTWQQILSKIAVYDILIDLRNPQTMYAAGTFGSHGKLLVTYDEGKSWVEIYNEATLDNAVRSIVQNPNDPKQIVIGMQSGSLHTSFDSGATWRNLTHLRDRVNKMAWLPGGLYVLSEQKGLVKTVDGGVSFKSLNPTLAQTDSFTGTFLSSSEPLPTAFNQFAINHTDPRTIYMTTDTGMFKTTDEGVSWNKLKLPLGKRSSQDPVAIRAVTVFQANPTILYASAGATLYRSSNAGDTWQTQSVDTQGFVQVLTVNPRLPQSAVGGVYINK